MYITRQLTHKWSGVEIQMEEECVGYRRTKENRGWCNNMIIEMNGENGSKAHIERKVASILALSKTEKSHMYVLWNSLRTWSGYHGGTYMLRSQEVILSREINVCSSGRMILKNLHWCWQILNKSSDELHHLTIDVALRCKKTIFEETQLKRPPCFVSFHEARKRRLCLCWSG